MRVGGESGVGGVWGQLFGNDTLLTVLALILMLHARGYTQSILMQLALARKDELFNGSIIASSSFYTGSFQGCNYFHTWFNSRCRRHIQYAHIPRPSWRHMHNHMELSWQVIHHTITQFCLIIQSGKVKLLRIRFHQCLHSYWIPKQRLQTLRGLEIDGLALDVSPWGGQVCLFAVLQSHLVALLQNQWDKNSKYYCLIFSRKMKWNAQHTRSLCLIFFFFFGFKVYGIFRGVVESICKDPAKICLLNFDKPSSNL